MRKLKRTRIVVRHTVESIGIVKVAQRSTARSKMIKEQEQEYLMQGRSCIQEYCAKKKLRSCEVLNLSVSPYRTTHAKGKAVKHVQNALPISPRKR